ncbi:MAG TPA: acylphosphatase, partial [Thermoanaerobaculia bacterium]|jgi:acylphosphatase|nr:acylphosphatase [Thermoanaerobaculia bacterium]
MTDFETKSRRFVVAGRVQGVGYRAFAARAAQSLKLRGGARNLEDGRVEVVATGPEPLLDRLESELRRGPVSSRVSSVTVDEAAAGLASADFDVEF